MAGLFSFDSYRARIAALALASLLSACAGDMIPVGRSSHKAPHRVKQRPARAPLVRHDSEAYRQCIAKLASINVRYTALPDRNFGGGCNALGAVKLIDVGVSTTNLGAMTCPLASNFAAWTQYGVQPAARLLLGAELVRIETFGTYNCRVVAGSERLSEHARGNAVDIAAFVLSDGRRITVQDGWRGDSDSQRFLRAVRASACKRFRTVLSPDYNAAHHDHLHFDMGGAGGFCR